MGFDPLKVFLLFILILTTFASQLKHPFKQCSPRSAGQILKASVNAPCSDGYCTFYKGTTARLEFTFILKKKAQKVRAKIIATVGTGDHDFALPKHDVCKQLGCPLNNGTPYVYETTMFLSPTYPSVKVNQMRYYLIDGKGRELACVSLPVMITEKDSKQ